MWLLTFAWHFHDNLKLSFMYFHSCASAWDATFLSMMQFFERCCVIMHFTISFVLLFQSKHNHLQPFFGPQNM